MGTLVTSTYVKVMLSYNYNHFEAGMGLANPDGITLEEIDEARKNCQRLCDKAVRQYKKAKEIFQKNEYSQQEYDRLVERVDRLKARTPEADWDSEDKALVKQMADWDWQERRRPYDYQDEDPDDMFGFYEVDDADEVIKDA